MKKEVKKIIWQNFYNYSLEDQQKIVDAWNEGRDPEDEGLLDEYEVAEEEDQLSWDDMLTNFAYSPIGNCKVQVSGVLGLWNGPHKIIAKTFDSLEKALCACCEDYNTIYENEYGQMCVSATHHDGTNSFVIKRITDKGPRAMRFFKNVFGC